MIECIPQLDWCIKLPSLYWCVQVKKNPGAVNHQFKTPSKLYATLVDTLYKELLVVLVMQNHQVLLPKSH